MDGYDKVATVIGKHMDEAWKNIIGDLAGSNLSALGTGANITSNEVQEFFASLGAAQLCVRFEPAQVRPAQIMYYPQTNAQTSGVGVLGNVSVSIGVSVSF